MPKVGFVVRNKFQAYHFRKLAQAYPDARFLMHSKRWQWKGLGSSYLGDFDHQVLPVHHGNVAKFAKNFDVIFFQTVFPGIETISDTHLVSVQYGLAKERHNYGEWRSLADLNLMYGPYSARAVSHFSPAEAVGNLRFCGWKPASSDVEKRAAKTRLGFKPDKPVLLYMPTYGELSSFDELLRPLLSLNGRYQLAIKIHHNDVEQQLKRVSVAKMLGFENLFVGDDDQCALLDAADVVVSDFSGAIFDAIYACRPVVIFQQGAREKIETQKFDLNSLEYRLRGTLGVLCTETGRLSEAVDEAITAGPRAPILPAGLYDDLFKDVSSGRAVSHALSCVDRLLAGEYALTPAQSYVRQTVKKLLHLQRNPRLAFNTTFKKKYAF